MISTKSPSIYKTLAFTLILPCIIAIPTPKTFYETSIAFLRFHKCVMPSAIVLPFTQTLDPDLITFDYLSAPLKECQFDEANVVEEEAHLLCKEIFDVLQNITCPQYKNALPRIESTRVSNDVCQEFKDMKEVLPKQNEYLSGKLVDSLICKLLCAKKFDSLCHTLLWSYDVQEQIKNVLKNESTEANNKKSEIVSIKDSINNGTKTITNGADETTPNNNNEAKGIGIEPQQEPLLDVKTKKSEDQPLDNENRDSQDKENMAHDDNSINEALPSKTVQTFNQSGSIEIVVPDSIKTSLGISVPDGINNKNLTIDAQTLSKTPVNIALPGVQVELITDSNESKNHILSKATDVTQHKDSSSDLKETQKVLITESILESKNSGNILGTAQDLTKVKSPKIINTPGEKNDTFVNTVELKPFGENELNDKYDQEKEHETVQNLPKSIIPDKTADIKTIKQNDIGKNKNIEPIELSTMQISPEEEPENKESEQYFNNQNNEIPKRPTAVKNIKSESANTHGMPKDYDMLLSRENFEHSQEILGPEPVFPEQEDSHFFFYLLSIVLIMMAGYVVFHNKQKILALIVEGRHERRRRSHGAGYKKLETK